MNRINEKHSQLWQMYRPNAVEKYVSKIAN